MPAKTPFSDGTDRNKLQVSRRRKRQGTMRSFGAKIPVQTKQKQSTQRETKILYSTNNSRSRSHRIVYSRFREHKKKKLILIHNSVPNTNFILAALAKSKNSFNFLNT